MIGIFIALISGALMSIQGVFNTEVTKSSSMCPLTSANAAGRHFRYNAVYPIRFPPFLPAWRCGRCVTGRI